MDYYLNTHMKIVDKHWRQFGLKSWTIVEFQEGDPSGLWVQAIMHWESIQAFEKALEANIPEVMEDLKNYSTVMPVRYYATIKAQG